jgi:hypothetical protein
MVVDVFEYMMPFSNTCDARYASIRPQQGLYAFALHLDQIAAAATA